MDLSGIVKRADVSRRTIIGGVVAAVSGAAGVSQTGGEQLVNYLTDERNDDEEPTVERAQPGDGSDGNDGSDDGGGNRTKEVISQVDLTERDGRVTIRLGAYERVVADLNRADGNSVGQSAWRVDGSLAARSGVSFRAREGNTVEVTLQNPTPVPYSLSIRTDDGDSDGDRVSADGRGVVVYAGGVERVVLDNLAHGAYAYEIETLTRPIEPLVGRLLIDGEGEEESRTPTNETDASETNTPETDTPDRLRDVRAE